MTEQLKCQNCGKPFLRQGKGRIGRYCGAACQREAYRQRHGMGAVNRTCYYCQTPLDAGERKYHYACRREGELLSRVLELSNPVIFYEVLGDRLQEEDK